MARRPLVAQDTTRTRPDTSRRTIAVPAKPPADSLLRDSLAKRDSARAAVPLPQRKVVTLRDTLKEPLARAEAPRVLEIGESYRWDRAALFATGAITLQDLLDRVPGVTGLRSGWIAAPMTSAYLGDLRRVRLFYDGVEWDELDPRAGGVPDLTQIQLWTAEEVRVERGPSEIRVHVRSWRVDRTRPYTRADISTGDQNTNLYRGFFGRRYKHGEAIQFAAQQYGTTPGRTGASSDQLGILGRVGWSRGALSVDGFLLRTSRHRGPVTSVFVRGDSIASLESSRNDAYVRVAYGDPDAGPWAQLLASGAAYTSGPKKPSDSFSAPKDTLKRDTTRFRGQYILTGGITRWGVQFSATERLRVFEGKSHHTPVLRASYGVGPLAFSAFAEGKGVDSTSRSEVVGQVTPLSFVSVLGAVGRAKDERSIDSSRAAARTVSYQRMSAGVRLRGWWVAGGIVRRDPVLLAVPRIFADSVHRPFVRRVDEQATGTTLSLRGRLWKSLHTDIVATRWNDSSGFYRPRYQTRSELFVTSNFLNRFPSGDFGVLASVVHEYRSTTRYPIADTTTRALRVPGSRTITAMLEIRLLSAVLQYQFRNLLGEPYTVVPNFLMPRQTQFYGVRWEFWD